MIIKLLHNIVKVCGESTSRGLIHLVLNSEQKCGPEPVGFVRAKISLLAKIVYKNKLAIRCHVMYTAGKGFSLAWL